MAALKLEQERVKLLLCDTVTMLCKNGLSFSKSLRVQGLLGVTIDDQDILLVQISECFENHDGGAVNCVDSTNDQMARVEPSRVVVKVSQGGLRHVPSTISPRAMPALLPPPPPPSPSRVRNRPSNASFTKRKQPPVKWPTNFPKTNSSNRGENEFSADVKPDIVNIKTESSTAQSDQEDCEIINSEDYSRGEPGSSFPANTSFDVDEDNSERTAPFYPSNNSIQTTNSLIPIRSANDSISIYPNDGGQSNNFVWIKRELKNDVGSNEMEYGEMAERRSGEGFVNDEEEEGEWHEGDRSNLNDSYGEYEQEQSGGNFEGDAYESGTALQMPCGSQQPVMRVTPKKKSVAGKSPASRPRVKNETGRHWVPPSKLERGEVNNAYCVTKSLHECAYPDCGKQFRHKQHLLRHQTQKHNREPRRVLAYSKYWVPNDGAQPSQTEFADEGGDYGGQSAPWGSSSGEPDAL